MNINFAVSRYSMCSMSAVTAAPTTTTNKIMIYTKLPTMYIFSFFPSELYTACVFLGVSYVAS